MFLPCHGTSIASNRKSELLILSYRLLLASVFPSIRVFSSELIPCIRCPNIGVSASASVLPITPRADLLQNGLVGSPCSPRDSQESSPTPQFKSINSSVLSFLYSPTLTSKRDHWKNHSFDYTDLCWQSYVSAF